MQNRKWILTSLVMTFFGIPILAQFLAAVIAMLGVGLAGIIEVCNIFITPTIYLLLNIFMLALGALMLFFSGRVGGDDSAPEKREIAVWRQMSFFSTRIINPGAPDNRAASGRLSISPDGSAGWLADLMVHLEKRNSRLAKFFLCRIINPGGLDNRAASGRLSISQMERGWFG